MPSNTQRFFGVITSIAITVGGAWAASQIHSQPTQAEVTSSTNGLTVTFENVRNKNGYVIVMVFDDAEAYANYDVSKVAGYKEEPAKSGKVAVRFPELDAGPYAVTAFHDENANQDLDMNGQIPKEGYATSGASDAYDTPPFNKAANVQGTVSIQMHYLD
ncbi:DUF2141 domain-containing protein [Roseibium sp.]|uniref:DUF2141 domain-containing protein n=1 Tax=Roseibium sp. TaxID=1936156 RepID=UPI003B52FA9F